MSIDDVPIIFALRHFETEKNIHDIHGQSDLKDITAEGYRQADRVAAHISQHEGLNGITYFNTAQSKESALLLSKLTGLTCETPLSLRKYDMGVASGISHEKLRSIDPTSAMWLELFRNRVIDISQRQLQGAENCYSVENRIKDWWRDEGSMRCVNRVIVGSNSTLLMVTNFLNEWLPSSGNYYCFGIPNGACRIWTLKGDIWETTPSLELCIWPEIENRRVDTKIGSIQSTYYYPGWEPRLHTCIIAPGYFGNSRIGPYGLFVRLARALAFDGFEWMPSRLLCKDGG